MDINEIRKQYPQYEDLSDQQLVDGFHKKFYSDIPLEDFRTKVGFNPTPAKSGVGTTASDVGKLFTAGALQTATGTPQGIETAAAGAARNYGFAPQDILEYLADPTKVTNKLASLIGLDQQLEQQKNLVPQKTRMGQEIAVDEALTRGKIQSLDKLTQAGKSVAESIQKTVSPQMKTAMEESIPEGNLPKELDKALVTGDFTELSLGKNPNALGYLGLASKVLGSSLPALISGNLTKSPTVGGVVGGGGAASEAKDTAKEHANKMSDEELFKTSPYFQELLAQGMDRQKARELTIDRTGDIAGMYQGLTAALGSAFTTKLTMGQLNPKVVASVKDRLYNATSGALKGVSEESFQEYMESIAADVGINKTVVREIGVDSFANLLLGALGGAGPGVYGGLKGETKAKEPKFTTDEKGNLVKTEEAAPPAPPAPGAPIPTGAQQGLFTQEEAPFQVTPSERVAQTQAGQTVTEPIVDAEVKAKQEASDAAQIQIADLNERLKKAATRDEALAIRDQISKLELQVQQTPGVALDTLKQEYTTLETKKAELKATQDQLIQQREATSDLNGKQALSEQINALENQGVQINQRQQELLAEGKTTAKELPAAAATPEEAALELEVPPVVTDKVMERFGFTPKATSIRNKIRDLDMAKPEDQQKLLDEVEKHERRGAKVNMQAVEDYVNSFREPQEAPNVQRADVSGIVPGGGEPSVRVPSVPSVTPAATQAPVAEGVGSPVGTTGGPNVGEGGVREAGPTPLNSEPITLKDGTKATIQWNVQQLVNADKDLITVHGFRLIGENGENIGGGGIGPHKNGKPNTWEASYFINEEFRRKGALSSAIDSFEKQTGGTVEPSSGPSPDAQAFWKNRKTPKATSAAQAPTNELDESRKLSEKFNEGNPVPVKTGWFRTKLGQWQKVREGNLNIGSFLFGTLQNFASSDQAYQNLMRKVMFDLAKAGDVTFKQARQALMRIATTQATKRAELAKEMLRRGAWEYDPVNNWWTAIDDANNIGVFDKLTTQLAQRLGINEQEARQMMDDGYEANRLNSYFEDLNKAKGDLTRVQKKIDLLQKNRKRTKPEQKDLNIKIAARDKLVKDIDVLEAKVQHKDRSQVQAGMKLYNMHPEIQEGTRVWNDMRARTVKTLVDVGMLSEEKAQQWLDEAAYVPFFRDVEEQAGAKADQLISSGLKETMAPLRAKQKGSMLKVSSTTQNMKEWMQWALAGAVSNQQLNTMLDTYKAMLPDEVREGKGPEGTTFTVYRDGVERSYNVENPAIAQAFTRLAPMIFPGLAMYKAVNNISRHAITRFPLFSVMQVPADLYQAFFTSGIKNPVMLVANILKETGLTAAQMSKTRDTLKANAIINSEDYNAMNEADAIGQKLSEVTTSKFKKPWQWAMHTLDKFAALSDNVVRQAVYNELKRESKSEQEAMVAAAEIINFRRMSANPTLQKLSQTTMFFNPWLQILSVTMKTLSGKGITPQTRVAGAKVLAAISAQVFTLGFLVAAANDDDDNEQEKKARQIRDRLIMIPGTGGMGIPIRMDIFSIPYFLGMDTYHMMMKHEFVDSKAVRASLAAAVKGSLLPPTEGISQIFRPPVEAILNKDIHNNRELVSSSMSKLEPELQFNKATSEFAKVLGEKTGISPIKLEHVLRGYFGTVYALFNLTANNTIADMRGIPRPAETWREKASKIPNIGVALGKGEDTGDAAVSDFYEMADDISGILESAKKMAQTDMPKAEEYLKKNEYKIVGVEGINRALSDLRKAENYILNSHAKSAQYPDGMSAEEKTKALKEIQAERRSLTKEIRNMRKQVYK
jgi:hypothetical protein